MKYLFMWMNSYFEKTFTFDLNKAAMGIFNMTGTELDYNEGYLSFGFTADFGVDPKKKAGPKLLSAFLMDYF